MFRRLIPSAIRTAAILPIMDLLATKIAILQEMLAMSVYRLSAVLLAMVIQFVAGRIASAETASEPTSLATRDGVQLKISYFPSSARKGTPQSKQVTPVVMLHDYKSSRAVFAGLVEKLQAP